MIVITHNSFYSDQENPHSLSSAARKRSLAIQFKLKISVCVCFFLMFFTVIFLLFGRLNQGQADFKTAIAYDAHLSQ